MPALSRSAVVVVKTELRLQDNAGVVHSQARGHRPWSRWATCEFPNGHRLIYERDILTPTDALVTCLMCIALSTNTQSDA